MTSDKAATEEGAGATSAAGMVQSAGLAQSAGFAQLPGLAPLPGLAIWAAGWSAAFLLLMWTRYLHAGYLIATAAIVAIAVSLYVRGDHPSSDGVSKALRAGVLVLFAGLLAAAAAHARFEMIEFRWRAMEAKRERTVALSLAARMSELEQRAGRAAREAADVGRDTSTVQDGTQGSTHDLLSRLDSVQARTGVDAIAVLSNTGELLGWAGSHRGPLPDRVRMQSPPVYFAERALFSYLYYSVAVPGAARHAVAAVLIETGFTGDKPKTGFAASFRDQVDAEVTFHAGHPGMGGKAVWSLVSNGDTIVHARVVPITQTERRHQAEVLPRVFVMLIVLLAYCLLGVAWIRFTGQAPTHTARGVPLLAAIPLFAAAPLSEALGMQGAFSPMLLLLGSADISLGSILAVVIPLTAFVASMRRSPVAASRRHFAVALGAVVTGAAFMLCTNVMLRASTPALLQGGRALWFGLQILGTLLLAMIAVLAMPCIRAEEVNGAEKRTAIESGAEGRPRHRREMRDGDFLSRLSVVTGVVLSFAFGVFVSSTFVPDVPVRSTLALLWALPFACFAFGLARSPGRSGGLARWMAAGWLAATVLVPHVWDAQIDARLDTAETELATLGTNADPYLDYLLDSFGRQAVLRFEAGEDSVPLLYGTWVASGLAREPYPAQIMLWPPNGAPTVQLGAQSELHTVGEDSLLMKLVAAARDQNVQSQYAFTDRAHIAHALMVPLGNGEVVSVVVPPRRTLDRRFGVTFFLGGVLPAHTRLNLVEAKNPQPSAPGVTWSRSTPEGCAGDVCSDGWRSQTVVRYPNGVYYAHLLVPVAPIRVRVARAVLVIAFDLLLLLVLLAAGTAARGVAPIEVSALRDWIRSFRARITIALFAFFLIPTMLFGYIAYRALAQEVERATQLVAERAAAHAASEFPSETNNLVEMSTHTDTDILQYHGGELIAVSSPEALELGVYGAWMPSRVYRALATGAESGVVDVEQLGTERLLTAYHVLQASGTIAIPMPVVSSDTAERQRELADVVLFAALIGAALSVALSLAVGRALARPIARLTRASAAIGAGRLGVRLPDKAPGEFGQLYESFNQMVRRLRRARSRELRTARVLAWGEMARQVAHEIKNPLTPIKLAVQHMRRAYRDRHPDFESIMESNVSQILVEIDHLSEISRAFSRYGAPAQEAGALQPVDVGQIVREAMTLYRTGDSRLRYLEEISGDLPAALARPGELKEVLFNLIENARAAIDGAGSITVHAHLTDGQVYVEVRDTGTGIPSEMLTHIFDPHFSTRTSGTGLGLAIVRRLVESWGGTVEAESEPGKGTTMCVHLLPADVLNG